MSRYQEYKSKRVQDPEVKREFDAQASEYRHKSLEERAAEFGGDLRLDGEFDWGSELISNTPAGLPSGNEEIGSFETG